jgi:hypothetical protein
MDLIGAGATAYGTAAKQRAGASAPALAFFIGKFRYTKLPASQ